MNQAEHAVILVHATSHALRAEKILARAGIPCKLIPVPRHLSSDCGVCIRVERSDQEAAQGRLEDSDMEIDSIHDI